MIRDSTDFFDHENLSYVSSAARGTQSRQVHAHDKQCGHPFARDIGRANANRAAVQPNSMPLNRLTECRIAKLSDHITCPCQVINNMARQCRLRRAPSAVPVNLAPAKPADPFVP
jgi:hypothetical protein